MPYLPSTDGTPVNRPMGLQDQPTDARSKFHDRTNFLYRDYRDAAEVFSYLDTVAKRTGNFPIYIHNGGTLNSNGTYTGGFTETFWLPEGKELADLEELATTAPYIYYESNDFTGELTSSSPLRRSPTGITAGVYENPTITLNSSGLITDIEEGTGGGTITSFVTPTDVEIIDNTKGLVEYDTANNSKYRITITNGAIVLTNIYSTSPNVFLADFTGTAGTDFADYTPDTGKGHVNPALNPITLDGSGNATFSSAGVVQLLIDTPIPAYRKTTIIVNSLAAVSNNHVQHTVLFSTGGTNFITASLYYVGTNQVALVIANQAGTLVQGPTLTITYPVTFTVSYTSPGRIVMAIGSNTIAYTQADLTGLFNYADIVTIFGAVLGQVKLEYQAFVNPTVFYDTFTGGAGNYTGHTADIGSGTVTTGGSFKPLLLDGSGNAVFDTTGVTQLIPAGTVSSSRRTTVVIISVPTTGGGSLFQTGVLQNVGNTVYRFVSVQYVDSTHVALVIAGEGGPITSNTSLAITYPLTLIVDFNGTNITASINGLTPITTSNIGSGLNNYVDFVGVNGSVISSAKVENV